ncbi:MAG: hypothetical protein ACKOQ8_05250 [Micrococcales bacterium]
MAPNAGKLFARVIIDSNLPQLDREFEYLVPERLADSIQIGQEVSVLFGRGKTPTKGYVVGISDTAEHVGELAVLEAITNEQPILFPATYRLLKRLSERQACTVAELLRLALPNRASTVDKKSVEFGEPSTSGLASGRRASVLVEPFQNSKHNRFNWATDQIRKRLDQGESVLLLVPDERSLKEFASSLRATGIAASEYSASLTKVAKYTTFLAASRVPGQLIIGTRSSAFLPVKNLGLVLVWDEGDSSYIELSAPYLSAREVVLVRQQLEEFDLVFFGNTVSSDVQRLCEVGYLEVADAVEKKPAVASSDASLRLDSLAWKAISQALQANRPVLVQVASRGNANSAFCRSCRERIQCKNCHGPVWIDSAGKVSCRWCNAIQLGSACGSCGGRDFATGRAGATRTVAEFGKAFPGARVIESSSDHIVETAPLGRTIVVATPGAEPAAEGGYGAVVLLDAGNLLARDTLRAREDALRIWANAISHLSETGRVTLTGVTGELAQYFSLWNIRRLMSQEVSARRELAFPPAVRMASVISSEEALLALVEQVRDIELIEPLGPLPVLERKAKVQDEWRLLLKYPYSATAEVSKLLKAFQLERSVSSKAYNARSGRAMRPVRVRMDEIEVI